MLVNWAIPRVLLCNFEGYFFPLYFKLKMFKFKPKSAMITSTEEREIGRERKRDQSNHISKYIMG